MIIQTQMNCLQALTPYYAKNPASLQFVFGKVRVFLFLLFSFSALLISYKGVALHHFPTSLRTPHQPSPLPWHHQPPQKIHTRYHEPGQSYPNCCLGIFLSLFLIVFLSFYLLLYHFSLFLLFSFLSQSYLPQLLEMAQQLSQQGLLLDSEKVFLIEGLVMIRFFLTSSSHLFPTSLTFPPLLSSLFFYLSISRSELTDTN